MTKKKKEVKFILEYCWSIGRDDFGNEKYECGKLNFRDKEELDRYMKYEFKIIFKQKYRIKKVTTTTEILEENEK